MKTEKDFKSRAGYLSHKFYHSGINGNPIISDKELVELKDFFTNLANFMSDANNSDMVWIYRTRAESVEKMIEARKSCG